MKPSFKATLNEAIRAFSLCQNSHFRAHPILGTVWVPRPNRPRWKFSGLPRRNPRNRWRSDPTDSDLKPVFAVDCVTVSMRFWKKRKRMTMTMKNPVTPRGMYFCTFFAHHFIIAKGLKVSFRFAWKLNKCTRFLIGPPSLPNRIQNAARPNIASIRQRNPALSSTATTERYFTKTFWHVFKIYQTGPLLVF